MPDAEISRIAKFIDERVYFLKGRKNQRDIANEAGYANQNMITMLKQGDAKLPLDRVPGMARALEVDPAHLFRLALEQNFENEALTAVREIFGTVLSKSEAAIIEAIRAANSEGAELNITEDQLKAVAKIFTAKDKVSS